MDISASIPVVTGASRGLGRHLVDALLERGARKVYALARDATKVRQDPRVVPVRFDLTDVASINAAAARCSDATLLIKQRLDGRVRRSARRRAGRDPPRARRQLRGHVRDDPRVRARA